MKTLFHRADFPIFQANIHISHSSWPTLSRKKETRSLIAWRARTGEKKALTSLIGHGPSFACAAFVYCTNLPVERHIRHGRRSAFQAVSEKAIVNDRWTSNGQHVLHTTAHKTYAYVSNRSGKEDSAESLLS